MHTTLHKADGGVDTRRVQPLSHQESDKMFLNKAWATISSGASQNTERAALGNSQQTLSRPGGRRGISKPDAVCPLSGLLLAEFSVPKIETRDLFKADATVKHVPFCLLGRNKAWRRPRPQIISSAAPRTRQAVFPGGRLRRPGSSNRPCPQNPSRVRRMDEGRPSGLPHRPPLGLRGLRRQGGRGQPQTFREGAPGQGSSRSASPFNPENLSVHLPKAKQHTGFPSPLLFWLEFFRLQNSKAPCPKLIKARTIYEETRTRPPSANAVLQRSTTSNMAARTLHGDATEPVHPRTHAHAHTHTHTHRHAHIPTYLENLPTGCFRILNGRSQYFKA